jgi:hypothetical protein
VAGKKARKAKKRRQRIVASKLRSARTRDCGPVDQAVQIPLQNFPVMQSQVPGITPERAGRDGRPGGAAG